MLSDLYQIFWNPPASYVHLLVHTIGWTAIVVAVYSYMVVVIHSSRKARRAHVRATPVRGADKSARPRV